MEPTSCPRVRTSPRRTRTPYLPLQLYEFPLTPAPPRAIHGCRRWSGGFKSLADVAFPLVRIVPVSYQVCEGKALGKARKLGNCVGHEVRRQAVWTQRPLVLRYPNPPPNLRFSLQTLAKVKFYFFETSLKKKHYYKHHQDHHQWPPRLAAPPAPPPMAPPHPQCLHNRSRKEPAIHGCDAVAGLFWYQFVLGAPFSRNASCEA